MFNVQFARREQIGGAGHELEIVKNRNTCDKISPRAMSEVRMIVFRTRLTVWSSHSVSLTNTRAHHDWCACDLGRQSDCDSFMTVREGCATNMM